MYQFSAQTSAERLVLRQRPGPYRRQPRDGLRPGVGYGMEGKPDFWIGPLVAGEPNRENHLAFTANDRAAVRAFFEAAVALGAPVLNAPPPWPEYHDHYYGAFVPRPRRQQR